MAIDLKKDRRILRELINRNFSFADLDKKFEGVDSTTGNVYCPFHDNNNSPSAKMYFNEDKNIFVLRCFSENRTFTTFDYVEKILCNEKKRYKDVLDFLEHKMTKSEIITQYGYISKNVAELDNVTIQKKIEYIDNTYNDSEGIVDYIEKLYTA